MTAQEIQIDCSDQTWELAPSDSDGRVNWKEAIPARVPGAILDDLHRAGQVPDPYHGENFREVAWVGERAYWYRCTIKLNTASLEPGDAFEPFELHCDGIDTYGEVFCNGLSLGRVDNQFRRYHFAIPASCLRVGENEITVRIDPVKQAFRQWFEQAQPDTHGVWTMFDEDRAWIRKAPMTFGWDNCPYLVSGGITLPIRLVRKRSRRLEDLQWRVESLNAEKRSCVLSLRGFLTDTVSCTAIRVRGSCGDSRWEAQTGLDADGNWALTTRIESAHFWWPNGMGTPHLYDVSVEAITGDGTPLAVEQLRIGLRQVRVVTEPAETREVDYRIGLPEKETAKAADPMMDGACIGPWERTPLTESETVEDRPFYFEVNGRRTFIKGFDWQAPDVLVGTITDERIATIIQHCVDSGANLLRAWGGGAVEREAFYDLCDEHGLLLWQDFFFACGIYPRDPAFLQRLEPEVEDVIRRLRNHTCLVAWCGDNESDMIENDGGHDPAKNTINKRLIPEALARLDWQERYYHCSSPSGGPYPRSDFGGDKRNWGPNFPHDNYRHIRQESARFISESGMKSFPSPAVIERAIPEDKRWPLDNSTWKLHWGDLDNTYRGDYLLDENCVKFFGEADNLEERVRLSQFAQAYGTRLLIEQCRRQKDRCGGILLWKTADQWPGCDQGIVDYGGVLRPVFRSIKEAFSDVIVSISQGFGPSEDQIEWWLVSDLPDKTEGCFRAFVYSLNKREFLVLDENTVALNPDQSVRVFAAMIKDYCPDDSIFVGSFQPAGNEQGGEISNWYSLQPAAALRAAQHFTPHVLQRFSRALPPPTAFASPDLPSNHR